MATRVQSIPWPPSTDRSWHSDCGAGVQASLSHYAPGERHLPHRHDFAQISFLLAGSLLERVGGKTFEVHQPAIGFKPPECLHEDMWGEDGVLIFSVKLRERRAAELERTQRPGWSRSHASDVSVALLRRCLDAPTDTLRREAVNDTLAVLEARGEVLPAKAPPWLEQVRAQILEEPGELRIAAAADAAGVHRAYLTKMFRRFYGVPPSVYRQRAMTARAVTALSRSTDAVSAIAADQGFSDQAHMSRCVSAQAGLSPKRLRALLGG